MEKRDASISVPQGSAVTDSAEANWNQRPGGYGNDHVYGVFGLALNYTLSTNVPKQIVTPGTLPSSACATLRTPKGPIAVKGDWRGDSVNKPSLNTSGSAREEDDVKRTSMRGRLVER